MKYPLRTVFIDIETSPCVGWFWRTGKTNITVDQILDHTKIICICWVWGDSKHRHKLFWDENQDDKQMLIAFVEAVKDAECVVGHNEKQFDLKILNTRIAFHSIKSQLPLMLIEDTLLLTRKVFNLPSFKLSYLLRYFDIKRKIHVDSSLWINVVFNKCLKSLKQMGDYCANDSVTVKLLYERLYVYLPSKQNYAIVKGNNRLCPNCGKETLINNGYRYNSLGKRCRMRCSSCGKGFTVGSNLVAGTATYPRGE